MVADRIEADTEEARVDETFTRAVARVEERVAVAEVDTFAVVVDVRAEESILHRLQQQQLLDDEYREVRGV